jgi:hypothetical protein
MILAYFREANRLSSSDLAPVTTILPDANIRAVVFGSRIRITTAAKRYYQRTASGASSEWEESLSGAKRLGEWGYESLSGAQRFRMW